MIALTEGGFGASVAPLGTAVTDTQLQMLWRIADEPVIALDGDTAGLRAAYRVIDLALPLLEAGKSLRFALMPEGKDPDDLIRGQGSSAVQAVLDRALPMVQLLWQRETEGRVFDSPERKAALDKALREKIKLIRDPSIRGHYGQAIKDLRWELFSTKRASAPSGRTRKWNAPDPATASAKSSLLVAVGEAAEVQMREAVILATAITCPDLCLEFEAAIEAMECASPEHAQLRDVILRAAGTGAESLQLHIEKELGADALEKLLRLPHVALTPSVRHPGEEDIARMTMTEELAKLEAQRGLTAELSEAAEDITQVADESVTWRLSQAAEARNRALRSQQEDKTEYDTSANGARIKRDEKAQFDALMNKIGFSKPQR